MRLSSISIAARIYIAVGIPILVLCLCAATYTFSQFSLAQRMQRIQHVTDIGHTVSLLVHELQKERGRSAGFVGAKGAGESTDHLSRQKQSTDIILKDFEKSIGEHLEALESAKLKQAYLNIEAEMSIMLSHRAGVAALNYDLSETVQPYTKTINQLLQFAALSVHEAVGSQSAEDLIGLLTLMNAKEKAGLERAIGSNIFSSQKIGPKNHLQTMQLISQQDAYLHQFSMIMGEEWERRLEALASTDQWKIVLEARQALISGGYDQASQLIKSYTGADWFAITTERIDLLMKLERELGNKIDQQANSSQQSYLNNAYVSLVASAILLLGTILLSFLMVASVVRPINRVADQLKGLAAGRLDIKVSGLDRKDEIGELARAAEAFLCSSLERQRLIFEKSEQEAIAVIERRRELRLMAGEVKDATARTVSVVSHAAEAVLIDSRKLSDGMFLARSSADEVNAAAQATIEQTEQATDLANELAQAISEVAESIVKADTIANASVELADKSRTNVLELDKAAQQITDFVKIITELAEQTNLLALNATIESARAGEAGKGFSVVAAEIKELANLTNRSASEISDRVSQIQSKTQSAVLSIGEIAGSVDKIGEVTSSVAAAIEEQRSSTHSFSHFLKSNHQSLKSVAAGVSDLAEIAKGSSDGATRIGDLAEKMACHSREMNETIPKIVDKAVQTAEERGSKLVDDHSDDQQNDQKSSLAA